MRGELEVVRRQAASGGQTVVYREGGGGMSDAVSVYIENRIVQLESGMTNVKSDLGRLKAVIVVRHYKTSHMLVIVLSILNPEFVRAEFSTEKNARVSDSNTLEEVATTVYLQKSDVSKLGTMYICI